MQDPAAVETTSLLLAAGSGDHDARERLFVTVYAELKAIAGQMLRGRCDTLQPTALVHEAWLRLIDQTRLDAHGRSHFVAIAARAMRFALHDHWRSRKADKRGGGAQKLTLENHEPSNPEVDLDTWLAVHEALTLLAASDPQLERIAELRLFGGLSHEEIAGCLSVSLRTVERGWRSARAFLARAMEGG